MAVVTSTKLHYADLG